MNKKVLFLSDDIRLHTGVSNITKSIILNTCDEIDWVQMSMGCTQSTPSIIDVSESVSNITGVTNCYVRLYETRGYGDAISLRNIIKQENPNAIIHMTDPHRWNWLYEIEHEIRETIPLLYYHVWDNTPVPKFLKNVYRSCDWIGCISKLTYDCVKNICPDHKACEYIPHGVSNKVFYKQDEEIRTQNRIGLLGSDYNFVLFFNNTNIPRKQLLLIIESFAEFYRSLKTIHEQEGVVLLLHTDPLHKSGCGINTLLDDLYDDVPILISGQLESADAVNNMYNLSHVTINVAYNEGFGLTTLESVNTETPVILSNTGGLRDQYNRDWCELVEPTTRMLVGTQQVPYLYTDICSVNDVVTAINAMYKRVNDIDMSTKDSFLKKNKFTDIQMAESIKIAISKTVDTFAPKPQFRFEKVI